MLSLSEVEDWHYGCFLVLWRIAGKYFSDELLILRCELEWNGWIIVGRISMLYRHTSVLVFLFSMELVSGCFFDIQLGEYRFAGVRKLLGSGIGFGL